MNAFTNAVNGVSQHPMIVEHIHCQRTLVALIEKLITQNESSAPELVISDDDVNGQLEIDFPITGASRALIRRTAVPTTANVNNASSVILPSNSRRLGLSVINTGTVGVTVCPGVTATQYGGIWLSANGGAWDGRISNILWSGNLSAIADSGTSTLAIVEV